MTIDDDFGHNLPAHARPPRFDRLIWEVGIGVLLAFIAVVGFLALARSIFHGPLDAFDNHAIREIHRSDLLTPIMWTITFLGNARVLLPAFLIALLVSRAHRRSSDAIVLGVLLMASSVLDLMTKSLFMRPRPYLAETFAHEMGWSFPSGHAVTAMCFYGFIAYLVWLRLEWKQVRWLVPALEMVILTIGFSRIYLYAHYPSDVLGGYLAGIPILVTAVLCHRVYLYRKYFVLPVSSFSA